MAFHGTNRETISIIIVMNQIITVKNNKNETDYDFNIKH
jgi:hypothetical protein